MKTEIESLEKNYEKIADNTEKILNLLIDLKFTLIWGSVGYLFYLIIKIIF